MRLPDALQFSTLKVATVRSRWNMGGHIKPDSEIERTIPWWNGSPAMCERYARKANLHTTGARWKDIPYIVCRLVPQFSGPAAALGAKWHARGFEEHNGANIFLRCLGSLHCPGEPPHEANKSFERFFDARRSPHESILGYLIRGQDLRDILTDWLSQLDVTSAA